MVVGVILIIYKLLVYIESWSDRNNTIKPTKKMVK